MVERPDGRRGHRRVPQDVSGEHAEGRGRVNVGPLSSVCATPLTHPSPATGRAPREQPTETTPTLPATRSPSWITSPQISRDPHRKVTVAPIVDHVDRSPVVTPDKTATMRDSWAWRHSLGSPPPSACVRADDDHRSACPGPVTCRRGAGRPIGNSFNNGSSLAVWERKVLGRNVLWNP